MGINHKGKTILTLGGRTFKKLQTAFSDVSHLKESKGIDGLFGCEYLPNKNCSSLTNIKNSCNHPI